jgi:ubiquinol-cytochrome c reductase iron-sulfur subunit
MTDGIEPGQPGEGGWQSRHDPVDPAETEGHAIPRRVIGTPPPAEARMMLAAQDTAPERVRELPADTDDPVRAKRAERLVGAIFTLAFLAGCGFIASYVLFTGHTLTGVEHSNLALGLSLALVLLLLGAGSVIWVRQLMPTVELAEERHPLRSSEEDRAEFKETFEEGADASQFVKRPLLRRTLMLASLPLAVAPVLLLRDLGPLPQNSLDYTVWRKGLRLWVYAANRPISPAEFDTPGSVISIVPAGYQDDDNALAKAAVIIIKFRPGELQFTKENHPVDGKVVENWTVDNIVAYSKICTHVGCPAALYEQTTHHILCPCHQSTFDATRGAKVIFGPASRPLPQLPITVDAQGYLVAKGDFDQPVGPSFWERGSFPQ